VIRHAGGRMTVRTARRRFAERQSLDPHLWNRVEPPVDDAAFPLMPVDVHSSAAAGRADAQAELEPEPEP